MHMESEEFQVNTPVLFRDKVGPRGKLHTWVQAEGGVQGAELLNFGLHEAHATAHDWHGLGLSVWGEHLGHPSILAPEHTYTGTHKAGA